MENIKRLREQTGAGMVDCKKALDETGGDIAKAVEYLRKQGIAKAAKREGRKAGEGVIMLAANSDHSEGYIVELNAETDFVARNEKFQSLAKEILEAIKTNKPKSLDELNALKIGESSVKDTLDNLSGTIGEKMGIARFDILQSKGTVAAYSHLQGKIGVLVALDKAEKTEMAKDIAMHIAASDPKYLDQSQVPAEELDKEKEIYAQQLEKEGKPKDIVDKIIAGKINKYLAEVCLSDQEYYKDDKKKVKDILGGVKVEKFIRYSMN